jgi:hypothetical protein
MPAAMIGPTFRPHTGTDHRSCRPPNTIPTVAVDGRSWQEGTSTVLPKKSAIPGEADFVCASTGLNYLKMRSRDRFEFCHPPPSFGWGAFARLRGSQVMILWSPNVPKSGGLLAAPGLAGFPAGPWRVDATCAAVSLQLPHPPTSVGKCPNFRWISVIISLTRFKGINPASYNYD